MENATESQQGAAGHTNQFALSQALTYAQYCRERANSHRRAVRGWFVAYGAGTIGVVIAGGTLTHGGTSSILGIIGVVLLLLAASIQVIGEIAQALAWDSIVWVTWGSGKESVRLRVTKTQSQEEEQQLERRRQCASCIAKKLQSPCAYVLTLLGLLAGLILAIIAAGLTDG